MRQQPSLVGMLLCWTCVSSCVCAPWLGPFRRTPLALHCTEGSSRGASAIPLGGCRLYSPECREGFVSETGLPTNSIPGNSEGFIRQEKGRGVGNPGGKVCWALYRLGCLLPS